MILINLSCFPESFPALLKLVCRICSVVATNFVLTNFKKIFHYSLTSLNETHMPNLSKKLFNQSLAFLVLHNHEICILVCLRNFHYIFVLFYHDIVSHLSLIVIPLKEHFILMSASASSDYLKSSETAKYVLNLNMDSDSARYFRLDFVYDEELMYLCVCDIYPIYWYIRE